VVSPFEQQIASALTERLQRPISVWCEAHVACVARASEIEEVPIEVHFDGATPGGTRDWSWEVHGMLIDSRPLEAYLKDAVADLGKPQDVKCAPQLRVLTKDNQIACWLANGGKAFVTVEPDGDTRVEIELDKAAADARSEIVLPQNDDTLVRLSNALAHAEDSDGEENTDEDAGAADAATANP
jgi:hypothetical protein